MKFTRLGIAARGMAMGIAEIIPGVSGGTIAFITGIYTRLLDAITGVDLVFFRNILTGKWRAASEQVHLGFLVNLAAGMLLGIVCGVFGISYMLEHYPEVIWALFFGLILASVPYMLLQMRQRRVSTIFIFLAGAAVAFAITRIVPAEGSASLLYIFFGGMIAICALVLPGISGSFILLLLGLYSLVIPTVKAFLESPAMAELVIIAAFAAGCLTGLLVFTRVISAAFHKYHDATIALLSGFMMGSLNKIWPWRNIDTVVNKETGEVLDIQKVDLTVLPEHYKILSEVNTLPAHYIGEARTFWVILAMAAGMLIVLGLSRVQKKVYED